ncbi:hypothetical protein RhiirC2_802068 [Rhizophagus irregularis]|uniref:Uncharacterized protein n=1 Tax=Rhizophagus irregularis TaxID=588596 RepID=A0A2N1M1S7_9GLOM|nr:hypothetical protein RhiirC2_802068 [Rhizophagus irregularis]
MSTSQYLSILLSLPCPNCLDIIASNRTFYTRVSALATIGITNQCCKKTYYDSQARIYKPIIDSAKSSCDTILYEILDQLELTHLSGQEKVLPVGFDCSWSHSRNAHQASGEFLYLGDLPGYNYQPVIGFYTVENSRVIRKSENDSSKIVYKGNFDGTLRKMEHAILLALLNNIMPIWGECWEKGPN